MKSVLSGNDSSARVFEITPTGIWLHAYGEEHFLDYDSYPWFRDRPAEQVLNVQAFGFAEEGLNWPDLDVDLCMDSIRHPENYPLIARDFR